MPVRGPAIKADVTRMGTSTLVTFVNRTGHFVPFLLQGRDGEDDLVVRVPGNDTYRGAYTTSGEVVIRGGLEDDAPVLHRSNRDDE